MSEKTEELKKRACQAIDENREEIIELAKEIWSEPELGYKEYKTTEKVVNKLEELGLDVKKNIAVTGAIAEIGNDNKKENKAKVAVLGELDAVHCPEHPDADPETGAVHGCGHHAQIANMIGVAYAFKKTDIIDDLMGSLKIIAVPAEEYLDLEYRKELMEEGKIEFFGGKQELIKRGYLDDVDMAMMIHTANNTPEREVDCDFSFNGFIGKFVTYTGRTAHAGGAPEKGINALNAANLGFNGINAQRETFKDEDYVRVHPIITKGGDGVNNVPSDVTIESYVRAKTIEAVYDANEKVNNALKGGAMSIGANVEINDFPGYVPLTMNKTMAEIYNENAERELGEEGVSREHEHLAGSTDMGDISQIMPALHPTVGGVDGDAHSKEWEVVDEEMAYIIPAKISACTLIDILSDEKTLDEILEELENKKSKDEYLEEIRKMRNDLKEENME